MEELNADYLKNSEMVKNSNFYFIFNEEEKQCET